MAKTTYISQINGNNIAAAAVVPASALATELSNIEQSIASMGSYAVVPLTIGENPVPDPAHATPDPVALSNKIIYLTKDSSAQAPTDPYTEWIYIGDVSTLDPTKWEIIGTTSMTLDKYLMKSETTGLMKNDGSVDTNSYKTTQEAVNDPVASGNATSFIDTISQNDNGVITATKKTIPTATASVGGQGGNDGLMTAVDKEALAGKADKVIMESGHNGNFAGLDANGNLTDSNSKASDFATSTHDHGNITNAGALQTADVTIASGDKLVITDSSDSDKVARASVAFDGSTTTTALTPKGTFESFAKEADITLAIGALDVSDIVHDTEGSMAGKTLLTLSETDGKISATFQDIVIAESKVTGLTDDLAAKANKTEMSVVPGSGTDADKTTITLQTGKSATVLTAHQDISGKADKVSGATNGHLAGLDDNGNLTDSTKAPTDFVQSVKLVNSSGTELKDVSGNVVIPQASYTPAVEGESEAVSTVGVVSITTIEL